MDKKFAEQGYDEFYFHLGEMYHKGQGIKQDYIQAFNWYQKSQLDNSDAIYNIGMMYYHGKGVKQDKTVQKITSNLLVKQSTQRQTYKPVTDTVNSLRSAI